MDCYSTLHNIAHRRYCATYVLYVVLLYLQVTSIQIHVVEYRYCIGTQAVAASDTSRVIRTRYSTTSIPVRVRVYYYIYMYYYTAVSGTVPYAAPTGTIRRYTAVSNATPYMYSTVPTGTRVSVL